MGKRIIKAFYRPAWKDHLTFTLRERRGLLVLFFLLSIEVGVLYYLRHKAPPIGHEQWVQMVATADSMLSLDADRNHHWPNEVCPQVADTIFQFDPNKCTLQQWKSLGLTERQATSVMRYLSNGGVFRTKTDLKRMRMIPSSLFESWMPYISLPDSFFRKPDGVRKHVMHITDINTADTLQLDQLRGVSPYMASRIIRYRESLGGFVHKDQLKEVYGMSDSLYSFIDGKAACSSLNPRKLNLNSTPWDSLKRHPYVGHKLAGMIDRYRKQHPFKSVDELLSIPLVTPENFRKLVPYLTVE